MIFQRRIAAVALPLLVCFSGCGYVHVGRVPAPVPTVLGDDKLVRENADLRLEKKILQQELALTRAQGDALRTALENRAADGETSKQLIDRLNETTKELAALRVTYEQLQAERAAAAAQPNDTADAATLRTRLGEAEEKLAASLRNYTELQDEIARLRTDVLRSRAENLSLSARVRSVTAQNEQAQAALAQLNADLLAQKDARLRAEQDAETLRTALTAVAPNATVLSQLRTGLAADALSFAPNSAAPADTGAADSAAPVAQPTPSGASGTPIAPTIRVRPSGVNATFVTSAARGLPRSGADTAAASRVHIVAGGDTLAKISARYYGTPGRWSDILAANRDVLGETNNLVIGRALRIP